MYDQGRHVVIPRGSRSQQDGARQSSNVIHCFRRFDKPENRGSKFLAEMAKKKKKDQDIVVYEVWNGITLAKLVRILNLDSVQDVKEIFAVSGVEVPKTQRSSALAVLQYLPP